MKREPGYYWVKLRYARRWSIAFWSGGYWVKWGSRYRGVDNDLQSINETRILNPDEAKESFV